MRWLMILLSTVSIVALGLNPMYAGNPASIMKGGWILLGADLGGGMSLYSNLFNLEDLRRLLSGATVTIDESRLKNVEGGMSFGFMPDLNLNLSLGLNPWRLGFESRIDGSAIAFVPKDVARILLGGSEYHEDVDEEFNLFKGNVSLKTGFVFGVETMGFNLGMAFGVYFPLLSFDPNSKVHFVYESDPDEGTFHSALSGETRFYTSLDQSLNLDTSSGGFYIDLGLIFDWEDLELGLAISNISPISAKSSYYGGVSVDFEAHLSSAELYTSGPDYGVSGISALSSPVEVPLMYEISGFAYYNLGLIDAALYGSFTPEVSHSEIGIYSSLLRIVWLDLRYLSEGYWNKTLGLNLNLILLRISAYLGATDSNPFNLDLSKMNGLNFALEVGLGL